MNPLRRVTPDCVEQLQTWIIAHCPCALEQPEFLSGFIVIIEDELERVIRIERQHMMERIREPSLQ